MKLEKSELQESARHVLRGCFMGAADAVPGVSGGTIALLLGIYEKLLENIQNCTNVATSLLKLDTEKAKNSLSSIEWRFLLPLISGIIISFIMLAQVIERLLENYPTSIAGLFFGLVTASVIVAGFMIHSWSYSYLLLSAATGVALFIVLGLRAGPVEQPGLIIFFFSGAIAISAMILPGISGSFLLLMIGMYGSLIEAVNERYMTKILIFGLGAVLSLGLSTRLLNWILTHYRDTVIAFLIGLMIGSLRVVWPWPNGVGVVSGEEKEIVEGSVLSWPESFISFIWPSLYGLAGFTVVLFLWNLNRSD